MSAKALRVAPISVRDAKAATLRYHYSGKVVPNSQLHLGAFYEGRLEGVMQFGPSTDKRKLIGLVRGTLWNEFIELNRMAFSDRLPRNSESRALGVAMRLLRREYPQLKWVVSFADATQCGDGTIYRAAGFTLTGIAKNTAMWRSPSGRIYTHIGLNTGSVQAAEARRDIAESGCAVEASDFAVRGSKGMAVYRKAGFEPLRGFQLRYIYFLDRSARERLTVAAIPYERIKQLGISMYKGQRRAPVEDAAAPPQRGGSTPTRTLQSNEQE